MEPTIFLIDSNVLIDIFTEDPVWAPWSESTVQDCIQDGIVAINPVIFAELSAGFDSFDDLSSRIPPTLFERLQLPWEAGFAAGQAFRAYRQRGGERRSPLPDFYIGAHAALMSLTLVTRNAGRYRTYFPSLSIVGPGDTR